MVGCLWWDVGCLLFVVVFDCRSSFLSWLLIDCLLIVDQVFVGCWLFARWLSVGWLLVGCLLSVCWLLISCWSFVGLVLSGC